MKTIKVSVQIPVVIVALAASLYGCISGQEAYAQNIPACRNVTPRPNQVCYTEHPFSARQRDEGGTREHSFIVERVAPNYVIVDYGLIIDRSFGAASKPQGSIVSSSGNASIVQTTRREKESLSEVRSQLKGKIQGCYPPICGQIQGQINKLDREIERLSSTQTSAVSAGGNEKILFKYTTSVSCRRYLGVTTCGSGAAMDGKVRVNQRYLGDPNQLKISSQALLNESRTLLRAASVPRR
jgi:hypothetical protein